MPAATPTLAPGARVEVRDEEWVVRRVIKANPGGHAVSVVGISDLVRGKDAIFLTDIDRITELAPEKTELVADDSPQYRTSRLYLESLLRRTPPPAGDARIYLGHEAAIRNAPYQLQPAAKALRQVQPRILMADGVGLGKTIEAGVLLTELIERGRGDRILVVALKSILAQFQQELWARFTIPLVRLDSVGIQRVQSRIPSNMNPFHFYDRVIISIDTLKKDAKYRRYLEECRWDVIVIDECQNVAVRTKGSSSGMSQRARLAKLLARTSDALILTSATPHDGRAESFASVIDLLDPTAIADSTDYTHEEVEDLFIRRFKKDIAHEVEGSFRERRVNKEHLPASAQEEAVFGALHGLEFRTIGKHRGNSGILFRTLLLKAFLSSPAACLSTIDERLEKLGDLDPDRADPEDVAHDRTVLTDLRRLVERVTPEHFRKYGKLVDRLEELGIGKRGNTERVVVFSERIDTLQFLQKQLTQDLRLKDEQSALFYGALDDQSQRRIVQAFGTKSSPLRLLLASDAAAEGLNLHHFCHRMVHFDLPWSLITLEQRNGRIDRYGQEREPILTYLLTVPDAPELRGDLRILDVLIDKEEQAHKNIGDVAWLMDLHDSDAETERVARGIEEREDPDDVIPDREQPTDFLALLLGTDDSPEPPAETTRDPSLYGDDLTYCRDAFAAVLDGREDEVLVEYHEHLQGFTLHAPEDLQHRLEYLPSELRQDTAGGVPVLKLTTDRQRVMDALEKSREEEDRWPEWQLLWEQHPVCEWLDETLVAAFHRHAAPVLVLPRGLDPLETVVLFLGQLTNERGQAVVVDWFGVVFRAHRVQEIRSLPDLVAATGLDQRQSNPGHPLPPDRKQQLQDLLPAAVDAARKHLLDLRLSRMESLSGVLREGLRRLTSWHDRRIAAIEAERERYVADGKTIPAPTRKRLDADEHEVRQLKKAREQWIQEGMRTNPNPYVRVVAVLAPILTD